MDMIVVSVSCNCHEVYVSAVSCFVSVVIEVSSCDAMRDKSINILILKVSIKVTV